MYQGSVFGPKDLAKEGCLCFSFYHISTFPCTRAVHYIIIVTINTIWFSTPKLKQLFFFSFIRRYHIVNIVLWASYISEYKWIALLWTRHHHKYFHRVLYLSTYNNFYSHIIISYLVTLTFLIYGSSYYHLIVLQFDIITTNGMPFKPRSIILYV